LSSLLRADAVAIYDYRTAGVPVTMPRVFGSRVLRGDSVGLQTPLPLAAPIVHSPVAHASMFALEAEVEAPTLSAPDFGDVEEAARLEGYSAGFEEGHAAGLAAAEEAVGPSIQRLTALVAAIHENHQSFFRSAERQVVDLALQIAQKVVEREVENIPDMAINVIRAALEEMDARTAVRVRVNPADEELLRRRWSQIVPPGIGADRVELQKDEKVQSGGAIIETTHGQVDAQLESKLAQLGNALWTFVMDVSTAQDQDGADA
jgi:flagellar biosynthesis/type III secretory pathway protein FliH